MYFTQQKSPDAIEEHMLRDYIKQQLEFVEQMTKPNVDDTIARIKRVWFDEFKVLLVSAAVSGCVRKFVSDSPAVEFWVGSYSTWVIEKLIDIIVFSSGTGPGKN